MKKLFPGIDIAISSALYTHHGIYMRNGKVIHYSGFAESGKKNVVRYPEFARSSKSNRPKKR